MPTSTVTYLGDLRTTSVHEFSQSHIITDAPLDNHGKAQAFSPTDMVANSLATCMFTVMGIKARDMQVDIAGSTATVTKIMGTEPRRITAIQIQIVMKGNFDSKTKTILENTAKTCPVWHSLHPEIKKEIEFNWDKI